MDTTTHFSIPTDGTVSVSDLQVLLAKANKRHGNEGVIEFSRGMFTPEGVPKMTLFISDPK